MINRKRKFPFSNGPFSKPIGSLSFGSVSEWSYVSLLSSEKQTSHFWQHCHRLKWEKQPDLVDRMESPPVANIKHLKENSTKIPEILKIKVVPKKKMFLTHSESTSATLWQVWQRLEVAYFMHASVCDEPCCGQLHPDTLTEENKGRASSSAVGALPSESESVY